MAHRIGRSQKVTNGHTLGVSCRTIIRLKSDQTTSVVEVEALMRALGGSHKKEGEDDGGGDDDGTGGGGADEPWGGGRFSQEG